MLHSLSSKELTEWMLYAEIEPFGETRADAREAVAASAIVNHLKALGRMKGQRAKPEDFIPYRDEPEPSEHDLSAKIMGIFGRFRGKSGEAERRTESDR